jgi:hypothetical protein
MKIGASIRIDYTHNSNQELLNRKFKLVSRLIEVWSQNIVPLRPLRVFSDVTSDQVEVRRQKDLFIFDLVQEEKKN